MFRVGVFCAKRCRILLDKQELGESFMRLCDRAAAFQLAVRNRTNGMGALASLTLAVSVMLCVGGFCAACCRAPLHIAELGTSFVRLCGCAIAFQLAVLYLARPEHIRQHGSKLSPRSMPEPLPPPTTSGDLAGRGPLIWRAAVQLWRTCSWPLLGGQINPDLGDRVSVLRCSFGSQKASAFSFPKKGDRILLMY